MVKNCDRGLENTARGRRLVACGIVVFQREQDLGNSFSPYGPPSRQITYIYAKEKEDCQNKSTTMFIRSMPT